MIYSTTDCCWFSHRALGLLSAFLFFSAFPLTGSPKAKPRRFIVSQDHSQARARDGQMQLVPKNCLFHTIISHWQEEGGSEVLKGDAAVPAGAPLVYWGCWAPTSSPGSAPPCRGVLCSGMHAQHPCRDGFIAPF